MTDLNAEVNPNTTDVNAPETNGDNVQAANSQDTIPQANDTAADTTGGNSPLIALNETESGDLAQPLSPETEDNANLDVTGDNENQNVQDQYGNVGSPVEGGRSVVEPAGDPAPIPDAPIDPDYATTSTPADQPTDSAPDLTADIATDTATTDTAAADDQTSSQAVESTELITTDTATDGATEPETAPVATESVPQPMVDLSSLKLKDKINGKVTKVELFGAWIDVGVGKDALLHVSQIRTEAPFRKLSDAIKVGDELPVFVKGLDTANARVDLTMDEPRGLEWNEIREGMLITGKVERIDRSAVFVNIGAESMGRIHVSELAANYVERPEDVVKMEQEVTARVIGVNRKRRQIDLSIKAVEEPEVIQQQEEPQTSDARPMTSMELALRAAIEGTSMETSLNSRNRKEDKGRSKSEKQRQQQEEAIRKTLSQRMK